MSASRPRAAAARGGAVRTVLVAALLAHGAGCSGEAPSRTGDPALGARLAVSPTPASTADTRVVVTLEDRGAPASGWEIRLHAEGPEGARTDEIVLEDRGGGRYASGALTFPRPGAWIFVVTVSGPDERRAVFRRPVTVSGPPRDAVSGGGRAAP